MTDDGNETQGTEQAPAERLWSQLKRGLQDGADIAMSKAEELTQVGRARLDVAAAKTRLGRLEAELGALAYRRLAEGGTVAAGDGEVDALRQQIDAARAGLSEAEAAHDEVRAAHD